MLAAPVPSNILQFPSEERRLGIPFIPAILDDLNLSIEAFRLFCHLARRARFKLGQWLVNESLDTIGRICFGASYPNAQNPRLRTKSNQAIRELEARGMVTVTRSRKGNTYEVFDQSNWREPDPGWQNPNQKVRNVKSSRSPGDLKNNSPAVDNQPRSPGDLMIAEQSSIPSFEPIRSTVDNPSRRSPGDHNGYNLRERENIKDLDLDLRSKTLVKDLDAGASFSLIDDDEIEYSCTIEDDQGNPIDEPFDPETYDWSNYPGPTCPQVPREFWDYTQQIMLQCQAHRNATGHPSPIGDVQAYTMGAIRRQGLQRYNVWISKQVKLYGPPNPPAEPLPESPQELLAYLESQSNLANQATGEFTTIETTPSPPTQTIPSGQQGLHWSRVQPEIDMELARTLVKQFWRDLGLSWHHPDLIGWMEQASRFFPDFRYDPDRANFYTLPDELIAKLCGDLQSTIANRFGAT